MPTERIRVALIGLGKMGLSHLAIVNTHPDAELVAVCDSASYITDVLSRYTGIKAYSDYRKLLEEVHPDAVLVATPPGTHATIVRAALERNIHVYCEKPLCTDAAESRRLARLAQAKGLANQVGYHYRFVAAFQEAKRLLDAGVIGPIHHFRAEAYGPVVLRPASATWRTSRAAGGGCLYDYACHAIDMVHYLVGRPEGVAGTVLNRMFSEEAEDEVYATLLYPDGKTGQLAANWSDDSFRKMALKVTLWGANGRIYADRQEVQVYLRKPVPAARDLVPGWNVRYTTGLTPPVWFYLRGEEYSAQIDHFIQCAKRGSADTRCPFRAGADVDELAAMLVKNAQGAPAAAPLPARERVPFSTGL